MHPQLVFAIAVLVFATIVMAKAAVVVPEGNAYVVEQLGRYARTLDAGFHLLTPFLEMVRARHSLAEQALPLGTEPCRTRDDREVFVGGTLAYRVTDPESATYAVADLRDGLTAVTRHALRDAIGGVLLEELHASRPAVEAAVVRGVETKVTSWGIVPVRHEIADISRHQKESHT